MHKTESSFAQLKIASSLKIHWFHIVSLMQNNQCRISESTKGPYAPSTEYLMAWIYDK